MEIVLTKSNEKDLEIAKQCQIAMTASQNAISLSLQKDVMYKAFWDMFNASFKAEETKQEQSTVQEQLQLDYVLNEINKNNLITEVPGTNMQNIKEEFMPGIYLRKDGLYMVRVMKNGVRICKYTQNYAEAVKILKHIKKHTEELIPQTNNKKTLKEWADEWLETYKKPFISQRSFKDIKNIVLSIMKNLGNYKLGYISTQLIQNYLNTLKPNRTKERICMYLNALLQKAEDLDIISKNPFKGVIKDKKIKFKNYCYTFAEQQRILNCLQGSEIEHEIYIYLMTGCRPNEFPDSKNFDFENNLITIYGTKTENARKRVIEISQSFANYIKPFVKNCEFHKVEYISKRFNEICKQAKVEKPLLYRLRHTFATNHFTLGTPAKQVQEWLGHSSITLTMDTYTDIDKTATKEKIIELYKNFYYLK